MSRTKLNPILVALLALTCPLVHAQFVATILHPAGPYDASDGIGIYGGQQVGYVVMHGSGWAHAAMWSGTPGSFVDIHPPEFDGSYAYDADDGRQVGFGFAPDSYRHALLWRGTADSCTDLHPQWAWNSEANAVAGNTQVGVVRDSGNVSHAVLWHGTRASAVDLNTSDYSDCTANDIWSESIVGSGAGPATGGLTHGLIWTIGGNLTDVHPTGYSESYLFGVDGNDQVGQAQGPSTGGNGHAMKWNGTSASAQDINPVGFESSYCLSASNGFASGTGRSSGSGLRHALHWNLASANSDDLHAYLTGLNFNGQPQTFTESFGNAISVNGSVTGYGRTTSGNIFALLWTPVPEPGTIIGLSIGSLAIFGRARFRRSNNTGGPLDAKAR